MNKNLLYYSFFITLAATVLSAVAEEDGSFIGALLFVPIVYFLFKLILDNREIK